MSICHAAQHRASAAGGSTATRSAGKQTPAGQQAAPPCKHASRCLLTSARSHHRPRPGQCHRFGTAGRGTAASSGRAARAGRGPQWKADQAQRRRRYAYRASAVHHHVIHNTWTLESRCLLTHNGNSPQLQARRVLPCTPSTATHPSAPQHHAAGIDGQLASDAVLARRH